MMRCLTVWLVALAVAQSLQQPPVPQGSIEGVVVDGNTNLPLPNVSVRRGAAGLSPVAPGLFGVRDTEGSFLIDPQSLIDDGGGFLTGADGRFLLEGLAAGTIRLNARKPGYMDLRAEGRKVPENIGVLLTLGVGQRLQGMVLRLFPAAIVTGQVMDSREEPVTGATVFALHDSYNEVGELVPREVGGAQTDDRGKFRFNALPPGSYRFRFARSTVRFGQGNPGSPVSFYTVYYPGARDLAEATPVRIESGAETRLDRVTLPSGRSGILSVRINRDAGPSQRTQIVLWRPGEPTDTTYGYFSDPSGGVVGQLPAGTYHLEVDTGPSRSYTLVEVGEQDLSVNVTMPKPAIILGRAGIGDPAVEDQFRPVPDIRIDLIDTIANNSGNRPTLVSGPDGRFTNPSVKTGLFYVASATVPSGMYLRAVRMGNRDVYGEKFSIDSGDVNLNVILGEGTGVVRGTVTDSKGKKVPGAVVALMPDDRTQRALIVSKMADGEGAFELKCAIGSYHLYAWTELDGAAYRNVEFMKTFNDQGKPVQVVRDSQVTVAANLADQP